MLHVNIFVQVDHFALKIIGLRQLHHHESYIDMFELKTHNLEAQISSFQVWN